MPRLPQFQKKSQRGVNFRKQKAVVPDIKVKMEDSDDKEQNSGFPDKHQLLLNNFLNKEIGISYVKQEVDKHQLLLNNLNKEIDISYVKQEVDDTRGINYIPRSQSSTKVTKNQTIGQLFVDVLSVSTSDNNKKSKKATDPIRTFNLKNIMDESLTNSKPRNKNSVCILCAATGTRESSSKPIKSFAKLIQDFSGVDILGIDASPSACSSCYKQLQLIDNFKKQILYTQRLIMTTDLFEEFRSDGDLASGALRSTLDSVAVDSNSQTTKKNQKEGDENSESEEDWFTWHEEPETSKNDLDSSEIQIVEVESIMNKNLSPHKNRRQKKSSGKKEKLVCTECGKQYARAGKFEQHMIIHGEKKHLCDICGKMFFHELNLIRHTRSHTGEKPFTCNYCNRQFSLRWNMLQHKRLHTNTLPYVCKLCPYASRHNVTLKKHVRKCHSAQECAAVNAKTNNNGDVNAEANINN